jgi:hypothetical protein
MNLSTLPKPLECKYQANLRQLDEGETIRHGDFYQSWIGCLMRVTEIGEDHKVGKNRCYYRIAGLTMLPD